MKYVFFDLDKTLIDVKTAQNKAAEFLFNKYGFSEKTTLTDFIKKWDELTEFYYSFYTRKLISHPEQRRRRIDGLFSFFKVNKDKDGLAIYHDEYLVSFEKEWCLFDDVMPVLKALKKKNYILGIISNGDISEQVRKCKNTKIYKFFSFINSSSQFSVSKPNPELFSMIFNGYKIPFSDVMYVGDSYENDIEPCTQLHIKSVLLDREDVYKNVPSDRKIATLKELLKNL